jgi:hypothetical protein
MKFRVEHAHGGGHGVARYLVDIVASKNNSHILMQIDIKVKAGFFVPIICLGDKYA